MAVLVYDDKQIANKSQIWTDNSFLSWYEANLEGNLIELRNQMRINANTETIDWIRCIIDEGEIKKLKKIIITKIFDSPLKLRNAIKSRML